MVRAGRDNAPMEFLTLSPKTRVLPVVHGSGDFAVEVRRRLLAEPFDCLAVPLPKSFHDPVREAVLALPRLSVVVRRDQPAWEMIEDWRRSVSYVPVDPTQPVVAAVRLAMQERVPTRFIDLETNEFEPFATPMPDPFALKQLPLEKFAAAAAAVVPKPMSMQHRDRCAAMGARLRKLEESFDHIVYLCGMNDFPFVVDGYLSQKSDVPDADPAEDDGGDASWARPLWCRVDPKSLYFVTEEIPFIVGRYEAARASLDDDERLTIDGLKDLLFEARRRYQNELGPHARPVPPQAFATLLKYTRNLSLMESRLTPDLYTLVTAAKQILGDTFGINLVEAAREYPYLWDEDDAEAPPEMFWGVDRGFLPDDSMVKLNSRLPGPPREWRTLELVPRPEPPDRSEWQTKWNPFQQCSWPPEDTAIERFRTHVKDQALRMLGHDLARSEKFTTSLKDGLDIRETLRNWHTGDLYVQELPPVVGDLDCVVMLFDSPADPRDYPYRLTWHAEHQDESTLGFFATQPTEDMVGPGIARARYGGALFLFPPRPVPEIWADPRLDFSDTLEERLLSAGLLHSREKHVALLSAGPPGLGWRRLAKRFGKKLIHLPLSKFSQQTVEGLRSFHVLNGFEVRSYAADFIRKA